MVSENIDRIVIQNTKVHTENVRTLIDHRSVFISYWNA